MGLQPLVDNRCPITSCLFTADRSLLNNSQVILFSLKNYQDLSNSLPTFRQPHQRFVFVALQDYRYYSKLNIPELMTIDNYTRFNFFNWTMTYRQDSDIFVNPNLYIFKPFTIHPSLIKAKTLLSKGTNIIPWMERPSLMARKISKLGSKRKLVAWFPSECKKSATHREEYVEKLKHHIPVDVYGKCGAISCDSSDDCLLDFDMLRTDYKFYLAFEDSWCPNDITDYFYRSLAFDTVPIVLGGADYSSIAPPNSFINVLDFPSVKDLAEYLLLLNRSQELYSKYFEWKDHYHHVPQSPMNSWCDLCRLAHDDNMPVKIYHDIQKWWIEDKKCSNISIFYP